MNWNVDQVLANIQKAETNDLLDRVTAYRSGMEADAVEMIQRELHRRGVTAADIAAQREACERECLYMPDGTAAMCSFCRKPAVAEGRGWWKIWWIVPIFPRRLYYCREHQPQAPPTVD